jgi:hypothetical protein
MKGEIGLSERRYIAISIKHSEYERSKRPVLWGGDGRSADDAERCFGGYTCNIDKAELYSLTDFRNTYGNGHIKCDEPVKMCFDFVKRYKKWDTVLVDENELRQFLSFL